jgi:conjugal transfer/entry exclusion protein
MQEMTDTAQKISEDLGKLDSILQRKNQNYTVQLV